MPPKSKQTSPLPVGDGEKVVFIDLHYSQRTIDIDGDVLEVRDSRVTVTDPAHIAALEAMYGMQREKN